MAKENGVEEKHGPPGRMGARRDLYFSKGCVFVRTKLSESNHVVWGGEFLEFVLKTVVVMFANTIDGFGVSIRTAGQNIFAGVSLGTVTDSQGGVSLA